NPKYSPDGKLVVFIRSAQSVSPAGAGALFVMNADGTALHRVTPWGFALIDQNWSPDGNWIVFERPDGELYVGHPDGTGLHPVPLELPAGAGAEAPSWSPDGAWITFSLERPGQADVYMVRPDGSGLRQVTHLKDVQAQSPEWGRPPP